MLNVVYLFVFLVLFSGCSMMNAGKNSSGSSIRGTNQKEAKKIQEDNTRKYMNSYTYKMQKEVERRHKDELRRSKVVHKSKAT
jgi:hypothetical protein